MILFPGCGAILCADNAKCCLSPLSSRHQWNRRQGRRTPVIRKVLFRLLAFRCLMLRAPGIEAVASMASFRRLDFSMARPALAMLQQAFMRVIIFAGFLLRESWAS